MFKTKVLPWVYVGLWLSLVFWLSSQPDIPQTQTVLDVFLSYAAHVGEYLGLAYFLFKALLATGIRLQPALGLVLLVSFATALLDEYNQSFINNRTSDIKDIAVDTISALIFILLILRQAQYENSYHQ